MNFESLFVNPNGRTSRGQFVPALITLLAAVAFYYFLVRGRTGQWCLVVLVYPAVILHARRLHDMGRTGWLVIVPAILIVLTFVIWLGGLSLRAPLDTAVPVIALAVSAGFAVWGCVAPGQAEANRYGAPAASLG
jgi:uncharacterized membrane protein YhaH (DUF805 family)